MEEKYKLFESFDWTKSKEWNQYYDNLYPKPPANRTKHWKKKFYKLKVDPDFDLSWDPPGSSTNENTSSNSFSAGSQNNPSQYSNSNANFQNNRQNSVQNDKTLETAEFAVFSLFLVSIIFRFYTLQLSAIGFLIKIFKKTGPPKFTMVYLQSLFNENIFHQFIYTLILFIDRLNVFTLFPLGISAVLTVALYIKKNLPNMNSTVLEYANTVLSKRDELRRAASRSEVAIGFFLVIGIFLGMNSYLLPLIYWQFIRFKYVLSPDLKLTFTELNGLIERTKINPSCPALVVTLLSKLQALGNYFSSAQQ